MQHAAPLFEGKRDFAALATQETRTTLREVYLCHLEAQGRDLTLTVAADGFLRGMVRATVGTLLEVGAGKLNAHDAIPDLLSQRTGQKLGRTSPRMGCTFSRRGTRRGRRKFRGRLLNTSYIKFDCFFLTFVLSSEHDPRD